METDSLKSYLENIEEYVLEENKIVTYKWLSKTLKIHVNTAKQLLHVFVDSARERDELSVTYLLSGELKNSGIGILLANQGDLEKVCAQFSHDPSRHVYSVAKTKPIEDFHVLYAVDPFSNKEHRKISPVTCINSTRRNTLEIVKQPAKNAVEVKKENIKTITKEEKTSPKKTNVQKSPKKAGPPKGSPKKTPVKENKGTITSLFASKTNKASQPTLNKGTQPFKKKENIANFFSNKAGDTKKKEVDVKEETQDTRKSPRKVNSVPASNLSESTKASPKKTSPKKSPVSTVTNKSNEKNKGKKKQNKINSNKDKNSEKKRKRIQVLSDSDNSDDDMFNEPEPAEEVREEPEVVKIESDKEASPEPSASVSKRKKRKVVDKLVENDGYLETVKEVVYETDSDPGEEQPAKKKSISPKKEEKLDKSVKEPATKKAKTSTKQSSLMSFFKKQ